MARRLLIAALLAIPSLVVLGVAAAYPTDQLFPNQGDLNLYLDKARAFAGGGMPYRDFPFEYPPLAIVPMVVPYLVGSALGPVDLDAYKWLFAGWEAVLLLALGIVVIRIARAMDADVPGTALHLIVLTAGAILTITFRYDLFPALLMAVAVWAGLGGRPFLAGVAIGSGLLAKLFPIAVLPALAVRWLTPWDAHRLVRLGAGVMASVLLGLAPFVVLAGSESTFQFLRYNADRGLEIESIGGGLALLVGLVRGEPVRINGLFSSANVEGAVADAWLAILPVLTLAGFAVVAWLGWRRVRAETAGGSAVRPSTIVLLATVSLVMLLATAKVYSIQYVVWVVPLFALLDGRRFWLAAAIVALTMPIHPLLFADLVEQDPLPILVLNLRNGLLLALLAWLLRDLAAELPREMAVEPKAAPNR